MTKRLFKKSRSGGHDDGLYSMASGERVRRARTFTNRALSACPPSFGRETFPTVALPEAFPLSHDPSHWPG